MLSYRHAFHAGNAADVLKHSVLALAVSALQQKDKPFVYIETHAGAGTYNLQSAYAEKTAEYRDGVGRLWDLQKKDAPPAIAAYLALLHEMNPSGRLQHYPGSPQLARRLLRPQDRMQLSELHKSDFILLRRLFDGDKKVQVYQEDGLDRLKAKLPPPERRALLLIDPSYEVKSDYYRVVAALADAYRRFATGVYCLWYPVIERRAAEKLLSRSVATGIRRQLRLEFCWENDTPGLGMTGCGILIINPPYRLDEQAKSLLPWLKQMLGTENGVWRVEWLVGE
ncbi:MAG: 23S rRNA (adenine(2030)-N(6))-methyltransferase RlmJ [Gammaproteobacteria bacterium]